MNHVLLTVNSNIPKEYKLYVGSAAAEAAEMRLGKMSLLDAMGSVDRYGCFAAILWAALQKFHHGMTMEKTHDLVDSMVANGCSFDGTDYEGCDIETRALLAKEVLKVSGFFTKEMTESMEAAMPETKPEGPSDSTI